MRLMRDGRAGALALALLLYTPVRVLAGESLIVNGDFTARAAQGGVAGWSLAVSGVSVVSNAEGVALALKTTAEGSSSAVQELVLDPTWGVLRFSYQVRVKAIAQGKLDWNDARIALTFLGPDGKVWHYVAGNWKAPTEGWIAAEELVTIPPGAAKVRIAPAILDAVGEWELRGLRVELAARRGDGVDAKPPTGQAVTWGREPVEAQGPRRAVVCLNGLWRFQPALGPAKEAPQQTGWGWCRVPGSWRQDVYFAVTRASGPSWEGFNNETPAAWYARDLMIPTDWVGRAILLDLRRVSTDAAVFIDGREVGRVSWPGGEVDLTAAVQPGKTHRLQLKVVATADAAEVTRFMGTGEGQVFTEKAQLSTRGLIGDALLVSRPRGAQLSGCGIRTSVREKSLALDVHYTGVAAAGTVALTAVVRDAKGVEAQRFTTNLAATAGSGKLNAAWSWVHPQLWEVGSPHLYTLELSAHGAGLDDTRLETFGFREFRIDGKRFLLNEREIRLRPTHMNEEGVVAGNRALMGAFFAGLRANGFNCSELWPWNRDERGRPEFDDLWASEADRLGFLLICPAMCPGQLLGTWEKPGVKAGWQARMERDLNKLRNHPSVVIWASGANRFGHGQDQNPETIGSKTRAWLADPSWQRSAVIGEEVARLIKQVDPTCPVLMHAGGPVGDIYTANNYLCLAALQEREEWPSRWVADGDMPMLMVEFGTPLYTTFHRGRAGYGQASTSEPLYSEFCAIYQGADAYRTETPAYRGFVASTFSSNQLWNSWHGINAEQMHSGYLELQALFFRNTWRAWRTWGVTGGTVPWSEMGWQKEVGPAAAAMGIKPRPSVVMPAFTPGLRGTWNPTAIAHIAHYLQPEGMIATPVSEALSSATQETLGWIAGAPEFVDKTHLYRTGTKVAKQVALLNDSRAPQRFSATWRVELGGKRLDGGRQKGEIAPATTRLLPLSFKLPKSLAGESADGVIVLDCTIGAAKHTDRFAFRVYRSAAGALPAVALLDPQGATAALLKTLGVAAEPWNGSATDRLLVVGRNALAKGEADLAAIERCLRSGGRVLLMAQDPDWMRTRLGLRVARQLTRRGFPTLADHPALGGLDAEALRDWAGSSTLIASNDTSLVDAHTWRCPPYGWRWGARHAISSAAIEVPHRAGWRPLIACEFDSAYTPLAEVAVGAGMLTICTLDLEDHAAADPAAERLARALLATAATAKPEPRAVVSYLGGPAGAALLATSGIRHQQAAALPVNGLAVIGADATLADADLDAFLRRGGKAIFLPRRAATAPLGVTLTRVAQHTGSLAIPSWASCRGLLPGELRRRADGAAWIVSAGPEVTVGADGLLAEVHRGDGLALFFQLDADLLNADQLSFNRLTRWRWTRALAQVAANLGALCDGDAALFQPSPPPDRMSLTGIWQAALTGPLPRVGENDPRHPDRGISERARALVAPNADINGMQDVAIAKDWESYGGVWKDADGEAVFRRVVDIPAGWAGKELLLTLGTVDDFDTTFFDGQVVGATDIQTPNFWSVPRRYSVPGRLVTPGRHVIAVRVFDHFGGGGMNGLPEQLALAPRIALATPRPTLYHPDWREDFATGDDPYRYYRW